MVLQVKIPGCELWLDIIAHAHKDKTFYLVGGRQQVIEEAVKKLKKEFKSINILNYRNGYIKTENEKNELIKDIKTLQPDIIFVAMGSPKQELLMQEMQNSHQATYQGLGGSFDVYTGHVERAPKWWVKFNLEWAYRLIKQPSRIKRQIHLVKFMILLHLNKF
jgi:UDP-N-acetyl-D-mannosaminouronate:lipid I N-acetyl-D-mannosaminouronosyltransferase